MSQTSWTSSKCWVLNMVPAWMCPGGFHYDTHTQCNVDLNFILKLHTHPVYIVLWENQVHIINNKTKSFSSEEWLHFSTSDIQQEVAGFHFKMHWQASVGFTDSFRAGETPEWISWKLNILSKVQNVLARNMSFSVRHPQTRVDGTACQPRLCQLFCCNTLHGSCFEKSNSSKSLIDQVCI